MSQYGHHEKSTIMFTHQKRKIAILFLKKKPSTTQHGPPYNVNDMEFYCNFSIEYNLIHIVKPKFTRKNEI